MRGTLIALCAAAAAQAGPAIAGSGFGYMASVGSVQSVSGVSNIQFSNGSGDSYTAENTPNTGTVILLGRSSAFAGTNEPDAFNATYPITITLNDYDSTTFTLTFQGQVTGYLNNRQSSLTNTYVDPYVKSAHIGANTYTVTLLPWSSPGPPVDSATGAIQAYVTCAPTGTEVASVTLPAGAKPGQAVQGAVALNGPAPRGGATVQLKSAAPNVLAVPPSVFVPEGETSARFIGSAVANSAGVEVQAHWNGTSAAHTVPIAGGICWDVDASGAVNLADAVHLLRGIGGLETLPNCGG